MGFSEMPFIGLEMLPYSPRLPRVLIMNKAEFVKWLLGTDTVAHVIFLFSLD